jgi:hypothetical protein
VNLAQDLSPGDSLAVERLSAGGTTAPTDRLFASRLCRSLRVNSLPRQSNSLSTTPNRHNWCTLLPHPIYHA